MDQSSSSIYKYIVNTLFIFKITWACETMLNLLHVLNNNLFKNIKKSVFYVGIPNLVGISFEVGIDIILCTLLYYILLFIQKYFYEINK